MHYLAVITPASSDFLDLLHTLKDLTVQQISPDEISYYNLNLYDSFCILGGTQDIPLLLPAKERLLLEEQVAKGKRFFCEFCQSFSEVYLSEATSTRFKRLVYVGEEQALLKPFDLLDDQCNQTLTAYGRYQNSYPLLVYKNFVYAHQQAPLSLEEQQNLENWALWLLNERIMFCNFRLCNFSKARFAPLRKWHELISSILEWLLQTKSLAPTFHIPYTFIPSLSEDFESQLYTTIQSALGWYEKSHLLLANGQKGVREGLATEIYPDGSQKLAPIVRTDCCGEVSLAYLCHNLLTQNPLSLEKSNHLQRFCLEEMRIPSGPFKGMLRWTEQAFHVCYQDDVARALIPILLKALYTEDISYLPRCVEALQFLVDTTGTDGTRVARNYTIEMTESSFKKLSNEPGNFPCAHYNGYYLAALLLCYKLTGNTQFKEVGIKGLTTIMSHFPHTIREQSETQECCRLILPLAWLYWITQDPVHKEWLYQVTTHLNQFKHPTGAYLEWDTDYQAACSRKENSECSLLAYNGDPVVDRLYSLNWLPIGFIQAYYVTQDLYFYNLWEDIAKFMVKTQIQSNNPLIHGTWTRGFDVSLMDIYGIPYDVGWGPWAIESGWTIAEITSGLLMGLLKEKLLPYYHKA